MLEKSATKPAFKKNLRTELAAGIDIKQALAIAYHTAAEARKKKRKP